MGAWSLYFLAKIGLYWGQVIGLHWVLNLAFAAALAWPLDDRRLRIARHVVAAPLALALLYHDSFLPPFSRIVSQAGVLASFSPAYLLELAERFVSWPLVATVAVGAFLFFATRRWLRYATFAFLGLVTMPLLPAPGFWNRPAPAEAVADRDPVRAAADAPVALTELDALLAAFYQGELAKTLRLPVAAAAPAAFDVVILSICSMSWDDLDEVRLRDAPLLARFDIVFRQFNSAASYSGPAVLRLLRAGCGQTAQDALYGSAPEGCFLFADLARAGYKPALLMNHDGHFDNFAQQLRDQGGLGIAPEHDQGAPVAMQSFDGTPIHADYETLARWWQPRSADPAPLALLYNTITMHDGNRVPGMSSQRSKDTYKPRATRLFADIERFIALIEASKRPTLLLLVPEHGGAIRGDAVQVSGLREIPTPAITAVPAAVKLIGFPALGPAKAPIMVDQPSSYFALSTLLAGLMADGGRGGRDSLEAMVRQLPAIDWVAENEGTVLIRRGTHRYLRSPQGEWTEF